MTHDRSVTAATEGPIASAAARHDDNTAGAASPSPVPSRFWSAWGSHRAAAPAGARRINNFDGLRLLAAMMVVYGHVTADTTGTDGLRVLLFFSIGGYLLAGSWDSDPHPGRFLLRRFLRIWPAFATMVVVCAAASAMFPAPDMPDISRLASLFYLSNLWFSGFDWGFFPHAGPFMNRSVWMLPYEVNIYLGFALIAMFGRRALIVAAVGMVAAAPWVPPLTPQFAHLTEAWSVFFAGFFAAGVLLRRHPVLRSTGVVVGAVLLGAALLAGGAHTAGLLCIIPTAAVWIGERSWPVLRSAARFGDLSFGIFLWGWPLHQVSRLWLDPATPGLAVAAIVLVQAAAIAWVSWHVIEAPALRRRPTRSRATAAVPGGVAMADARGRVA